MEQRAEYTTAADLDHDPLPAKISARLAELKQQEQLGREQIAHLSEQLRQVTETVTRIRGAIQVLEELGPG